MLLLLVQFERKMSKNDFSGSKNLASESGSNNVGDIVGPAVAFTVPLFILFTLIVWHKFCKKSGRLTAGDYMVLILFMLLAISVATWLAVTLNPSRKKSNEVELCTVSGPDSFKPCVFPFKWKKKLYHGCTSKDHSQPWCSTETKNNKYIRKKWGNCGTCSSIVRLLSNRTSNPSNLTTPDQTNLTTMETTTTSITTTKATEFTKSYQTLPNLSLTLNKTKELVVEYNISKWNLPKSFSDCIEMSISNVSYPTFIDPEYRCREDDRSCSDAGNVLECWSFLLNPDDYLRRYFDQGPNSIGKN